VPSAGISKGGIGSIEDAVSSITSCLEQSERMIGSPIERVFVGISGAHIITTTGDSYRLTHRTTGGDTTT